MEKFITSETPIHEIERFVPMENNFVSKCTGVPIDSLLYYNNWLLVDDCFHYVKMLMERRMLNELIGMKLAIKRGLETIKYDLIHIKEGYKNLSTSDNILYYGVMSENFRRKGYKYKNLKNAKLFVGDLGKTGFGVHEKIGHLCENEKNYKLFLMSILKTIALDLYSCQTDRYICTNTYFERKEGEFNLGPLFDYEKSFEINSSIYWSIFVDINLLSDDILYFCDAFPEFYNELLDILDIDIRDIIKEVVSEYKLNIDEQMVFTTYRMVNEQRKELIRKRLGI